MDAGIIAGLIIAGLTIVIVASFFRLLLWIFEFQYDLRVYIFESNGSGLLRFILWFLWFPLFLLTLACFVIAALCGASLLKDLAHWLQVEE